MALNWQPVQSLESRVSTLKKRKKKEENRFRRQIYNHFSAQPGLLINMVFVLHSKEKSLNVYILHNFTYTYYFKICVFVSIE